MKTVRRMVELFYFGPDIEAKKDIVIDGEVVRKDVPYKKRPDMSDP